MTLDFFGLAEKPFGPTPDPRFLHLTPGHREALAQLVYGVQERKGFVLLTGEVGTGKTTLVQALLRRLDGTTAVAYVANSLLPFEGILEYALGDLGIAKPAESHAQRLFALQNFLVERSRAGQNTALILDEAQNLQPTTLEQIRLLSNFETTSEKILQIVLIGQPELRDRLDLPELRQLKQRIGLRTTLPLLTAEDTGSYIRTRLRVAGCPDLDLFSAGAVAAIAGYAGGIPRIINMVCDHCLVTAYADQQRRISREVAEEAITYLEGGPRTRRPVTRRRPVASAPPVSALPRGRAPVRGAQTRPLAPSAWGLAAIAGLAGVAGLAFLDPGLLLHLLDQGADLIEQAMRSARGLLGR
ncbi:MAG: AAA family ATPase [Candidatus Rokubacteria bacterium]|nr:AAA family ATPase [Candidatus Rokubacteria bacterium]